MFRSRAKEWHILKNRKSSEMEAALRKFRTAQREGREPPNLELFGETINFSDLRAFFRKKLRKGQPFDTMDTPSASRAPTPEGLREVHAVPAEQPCRPQKESPLIDVPLWPKSMSPKAMAPRQLLLDQKDLQLLDSTESYLLGKEFEVDGGAGARRRTSEARKVSLIVYANYDSMSAASKALANIHYIASADFNLQSPDPERLQQERMIGHLLQHLWAVRFAALSFCNLGERGCLRELAKMQLDLAYESISKALGMLEIDLDSIWEQLRADIARSASVIQRYPIRLACVLRNTCRSFPSLTHVDLDELGVIFLAGHLTLVASEMYFFLQPTGDNPDERNNIDVLGHLRHMFARNSNEMAAWLLINK